MELFFFYILFSVLVGFHANSKGHSGINFFVLAILLSPIIGIIATLILSPTTEEIEDKQTEAISFARKGYFKEVEYQAKINERVAAFRQRHSEKHWLESVWAESKAYELLN